jgi:tripartite-type tricarboxylate transporter receptor subunit TctC
MTAAAAMMIAFAGHAAAQDWPTRPITLIVPFAAGGGIDVSARIQALRMGELLGPSIVVENVGAASGMDVGQRDAKAEPDVYTLIIVKYSTHA